MLLTSMIPAHALEVPHPVLHQNQSLDTQILRTGQLYTLVFGMPEPLQTASDIDASTETIPDITIDPLPEGAVVLQNLDGSKSFMWIPDESSIGERILNVRFSNSPSSSNEIKLVVATADNYEFLRQQTLFTISQPRPDIGNDTDSADVTADAESIESIKVDTSIDDITEDSEDTVIGSDDRDTDIAVAEVHSAETSAEIKEEPEPESAEQKLVIQDASAPPPQNATLAALPDAVLTVGVQSSFDVPVIGHGHSSINLRALNLPKGAELIVQEQTSGQSPTYTIVWTPKPGQIGVNVVVLQLLKEGRVTVSRRLQLTVAH